MPKTATACGVVPGLDAGKSSHWVCFVTRDGEITVSNPVDNSEDGLGKLFSQVGSGTLVVVEQVRNIDALAIRMTRKNGLDVAYLPGIGPQTASELVIGIDSPTSRPSPPGVLLRHCAEEPPVEHLDIVGQRVQDRATRGSRTCSYSHATRWCAAATASASTSAGAANAACAMAR